MNKMQQMKLPHLVRKKPVQQDPRRNLGHSLQRNLKLLRPNQVRRNLVRLSLGKPHRRNLVSRNRAHRSQDKNARLSL